MDTSGGFGMVELKVIRGGAPGGSCRRHASHQRLRLIEGGRADCNSFDLAASAGGAWFEAAAAGARLGVMVGFMACDPWGSFAAPDCKMTDATKASR